MMINNQSPVKFAARRLRCSLHFSAYTAAINKVLLLHTCVAASSSSEKENAV